MSNNPKVFINKTCVEITFRMEEGLPLVATPFIEAILVSILAQAQSLYSVTVCHAVPIANHIHLIIKINCPELVPAFVGYVKGELSHAINKLLGRKKHTNWCDGYDSPTILDAAKVIERIVYLYTNPQKANLVECIEDFPNYTTWEAFLAGGEEIECNRIPRSAITQLPRATLSLSEQEKLARELQEAGREDVSLFIDPDAWMECFDEYCAEARELYRQWRAGNTRAIPPPGMFAPGGVMFANLNPACAPV